MPEAMTARARGGKGGRKATVAETLLRDRRLLVVSNREPFEVREQAGAATRFTPTVGGLVSALHPVMEATRGEWIAWKRGDHGKAEEVATPEKGAPYTLRVVPVSEREAGGYYDGFANRALWPLFHGFVGRARFEDENWEDYKRVNERFAQAVAAAVKPRDVVWIHDYQLTLVPEALRRAGLSGKATVGYFHHIPFPAPEVFRVLPWGREVLRGLLGAELIGFHTQDYVDNFLSSCQKLLGATVDPAGSRVFWGGRWSRVGAFPIGIDVARIEATARTPEAKNAAARLRADFKDQILVIGVDRLDYSKGLKERILSIDKFFERYPAFRKKLTFVQVAVPSRTRVEEYRQMKRDLDETVGRVNGRYADPTWSPIRYINKSLDHSRLVPLYMAADIALITPLRDGMNLVAMEYAASRVDNGGALILSDQAGAAELLTDAWLVNPRHQSGVADTLAEVIETPAEVRAVRMEAMRRKVAQGDVHRWMERFLGEAVRGGRR